MNGGIQSIGSIAREFANGFLMGRQMREQKSQKATEEKFRLLQTKAQLLDSLQGNDSIRTFLTDSIAQDFDEIGAGGKKGKKGGGIGDLFKRMIGVGGTETPEQDEPPEIGAFSAMLRRSGATGDGAMPIKRSLDATDGPEPQQPGSQTFGDISTLLTAPQQNSTPMPPIGQQRNTAPAAQPSAMPPSPSPETESRQFMSPQQIVNEATSRNMTKYFGPDQTRVKADVMAQAQEETEYITGLLDAYFDQTPGLDSFESVMGEPHLRKAIDTIRSYEGNEWLPKGWTDSYLSSRVTELAPGYKTPETPKPASIDDTVQQVFLKPPDQWTPQDQQAVSGWEQYLRRKGTPLSAEDQLTQDYINELRAGGNVKQAFEKFMQVTRPPQTTNIHSIQPALDPRDNTTKLAIIGRDGATRFTELVVPNNLNPSRWIVRKKVPGPPDPNDPFQTPTEVDVDVIDPRALIADHANGAVSTEFLNQMLNSGAIQDAADKQILSDYIGSRENLFRRPPQ